MEFVRDCLSRMQEYRPIMRLFVLCDAVFYFLGIKKILCQILCHDVIRYKVHTDAHIPANSRARIWPVALAVVPQIFGHRKPWLP